MRQKVKTYRSARNYWFFRKDSKKITDCKDVVLDISTEKIGGKTK